MSINTFSAVLSQADMITPSVKHFVLQSNCQPVFQYEPGQFITLHFEHQGKQLRRSYSIANSPKQDNRLEFAANYIQGGPGSELLFNLKPGDNLTVSGPYGRLLLRDNDPQRYIFVATSTGVTPYRAMMCELDRRLTENPALEVVILLGVPKREDILYGQEFLDWAARNPRVTFRAQLSREQRDDFLSHEFSGHVQTAFAELNVSPERDLFYLCGNPAMIDDAFTILKDQGFSTQHIIREKYISSPAR